MTDNALSARLAAFITFERAIRAVQDHTSLEYTVCNEWYRLVPTQSVVWLRSRGRGGHLRASTISGVSEFEPDAPLVSMCEQLVQQVDIPSTERSLHVDRDFLNAISDTKLAHTFEALDLCAALLLDLGDAGVLIVVRNTIFRDAEIRICREASDAVEHASAIPESRRSRSQTTRRGAPWFIWTRRLTVAAAVLGIAWLPIRQSVMAEAEIIATQPEVIATGIDGVIADILVAPNEQVNAGQVLVRLDTSERELQHDRAEAELALAREQLREARQSALGRRTSGEKIAELKAELKLKQLDVDFARKMVERSDIRASESGIAIYSRKQDWLGRAVQAGDRIMEVAVGAERRFEAWVAVNDAIELSDGDSVKFFPDAFPLDSINGSVDSISFFARRSDTDTLAYRVVADMEPEQETSGRLGMKGNLRLYGERVPLSYYLLRKPLAATRRYIGL